MPVIRRRPELVVLALAIPLLLLLPGRTPSGVYLLGLVTAAPLAMHAAGVILVFRSNRFLNFAQLQLGAVAATLFALLVNAEPVFRGVRAVCPPCLETTSEGLVRASYWTSLVVSLGVAVGLGWLVYVAVIRPLDRAPRLVATVASLFLISLLAALQRMLVQLLTTSDQRTFGGIINAVPPAEGGTTEIGGVRFGLPELLLVLVAVLGLAALGVYLRRSSTGTAIRASSESATRAQTLGIDVVRVTGRVWMIVGALSGTAALLGAMTAPAGDGTDPAGGSSLVRVLTVVVVARLVSLPMAGLAAVVLGVVTSAVEYSVGGTNLLDGALLVVISGLLLVQRREAPRTDVDTSSAYLAGRQARPVPESLRELPSVRSLLRWSLVVLAGVLVAVPFLLSPSQTSTLSTTLLLAVVGMSLLVLTGWAGLVSLGQFAFAAVGAYVAAASGAPFLLALLLGGLAGAAVAVVVGLPALRLSPLTLAISTLAFATAVPAVLLDPDSLGRALPDDLDAPLLLGLDLGSQRVFYFVVLGVLVGTVVAVTGLRRSRTARVLLAARDNEPATQAFGVSVLRARLAAFALSGFLAAFAGALFAFQQAGVRADSFPVEASLLVFAFTVIGGLGSVGGPLLGFGVLALLNLLGSSPTWSLLVNGLGGIVLLRLAPGGLAQVALDSRDALLRRIAQRNGIAVPGLGARDRLTTGGPVPITRKMRPGGGEVFVPRRYALDDQWALATAVRRPGEADHD